MQLFVGTSGYSYPKWRGTFYPPKTPTDAMLEYYGTQFNTVEINGMFYRLPEKETVRQWTTQVPAKFQFAVKAPQTITHRKRLKDVERETKQLLDVADVLQKRRGPILFGLPPNLKCDLPRLDDFLTMLARRVPAAFEFRHPSWFQDDVFACLKKHKAALCVADAEELPPQKLIATTDWGYVRLRRENYTAAQLKRWVADIQAQPWKLAYVFFKHEDTGTGPRFAKQFLAKA
jgi:uncharacterized protein YecE (DUF72 family)